MNTYCSMACSTKCFIHALFCTSKYITTCSHCTSNQHRLTSQLEQQQGNKKDLKRKVALNLKMKVALNLKRKVALNLSSM